MRPKQREAAKSDDLFRARLGGSPTCASPSGPRPWQGAMPTPSNSIDIGESCACCALGWARIIRDIARNVVGSGVEEVFHEPLARARQIRLQEQRQRGFKFYSFHAPEVECIGKGKARSPYEFGVKASHYDPPGPRRPVRAACHFTTR